MLTKEELDRLEALNFDHHLRMKKMHADFVRSGKLSEVDAQDAASRKALCDDMKLVAKDGVVRPNKILELGAGSGRDCEHLSETFESLYYGVEVVKDVAEALQHKGLNVFHCPIEQMPEAWTGIFGFVYSRHVMEHVINVQAALSELFRVVAPGGIIGAVTPDFPHEEPAHTSKLTLQEWREAYKAAGFEVFEASHRDFFCKEAHVTVRKPE